MVLAIDLQEANWPGGDWPVHDFNGVLERSAMVIGAAREAGVPVIFTRQWHSPDGSDLLRYEPLNEEGLPPHCMAGSKGAELSAAVSAQPGDIIIDKTRYSAFFATRLEIVLQRLGIERLIILGVWTDACLETTVNDAVWRGYRVTLVKDAATTATATMHKSAILSMANWLYGGEILTAHAAVEALAGRDHKSWRFTKPSQFLFEADTIDTLYEQI
ncbi:cysteine hydrolase family protein [Arsenicitalea aurantiaca]|uniref:cysteine hydrolase family protein n=1 Tax=Arsenicitalea aurantiaca TaxID=1783274 RepID=UPI0013158C09|nr:isochorismatase family cysteine hydrolase [Arsenicitalea aurantiaca]